MSHKPKILIVDDEPRICESLKTLLSEQGYEIHIRYSGKKAIEYLIKDHFDLVLLDIVMPGVDGHQIMDYIHRQNPDTLVIIMTEHASKGSAVEELKSGAHDYLRKPFEHEELLKTIENALDHKRLKSGSKRALEALREAHDELEKLVEKRTLQFVKINERLRNEIEERKHSEEVLKESEEKYRTLVNEIRDGFFIADDKGTLTFMNRALAQMHGYENPDEVLGRTFSEFLSPQVWDEIMETFKSTVKDQNISELIEFPSFKKDGTAP